MRHRAKPPNSATRSSAVKDRRRAASVMAGLLLAASSYMLVQPDQAHAADLAQSVQLGDFVWNDLNGDGVQDAGEPGIAGVALTVTRTNPPFVQMESTDSSGHYSFSGLTPGQYRVSIVNPPGYRPTVAEAGGDRAADSSTDSVLSRDLTAGERDDSLDFGLYSPVQVSGQVWDDANRSGARDANEPGIPAVRVTAERTSTPASSVTQLSDEAGKYLFDDLPPGQYTVKAAAPASYVATTPSTTHTRFLVSGDKQAAIDFGVGRAAVSVGDFVWQDDNHDGRQQPTEPGISGVVVDLTGPAGAGVIDIDGRAVAPVSTDANGHYGFYRLPTLVPGESYVAHVDAAQPQLVDRHFVPTIANQGGDATIDSSTSDAASNDLVANGDRDDTLDFGFYRPTVEVGDFVWNDTNRNGLQDPDEPGIGGVELTLTHKDGTHVHTVDGTIVGPHVTDARGRYSFTDLPPASGAAGYTVHVDGRQKALSSTGLVPTTAGTGRTKDDSSTDRVDSSDLPDDGDQDATLDFGFFAPVAQQPESPTPAPPVLSSAPSSDRNGSLADPTRATVDHAGHDGRPEPPPSAPLSHTGFEAAGLLALAGLSLVLGLALCTLRRRRPCAVRMTGPTRRHP